VQLGVSHHNLTKVVQDLMRRGFITARPGAAVAA
jgi:DNA-binding IscR family transcriptional regulator